jgi:regulator of cell morphogenesis and NO signaling
VSYNGTIKRKKESKMNKDVIKKEMLPKLEMYVPVVDRVHGAHHPEFHEVKDLFEQMVVKLNNDEDLKDILVELRKVTNNYLVPDDVCETYEAVYNMLEEIDHTYSE